MDSRAKFEAWCTRNGGDLHGLMRLVAWEVWQASRAAIEIDLSDTFSPNDCGDDAVWVDVLLRELNKHGIKGESS